MVLARHSWCRPEHDHAYRVVQDYCRCLLNHLFFFTENEFVNVLLLLILVAYFFPSVFLCPI